MAKRSGLTEDDLGVVETSLDNSIKAQSEGPRPSDDDKYEINLLAPLFRVREKILAMKAGRSDKGTTRPKVTAPRTTSVRSAPKPIVLTPAAPSNTD